MKRPWLYYITPLILLAVLSLIPFVAGLADINKHESYGVIVVFVFALVILFSLGVDYFIKTLTKGKIGYIWLIEGILVTLLFVWFFYGNFFRISGC